MTFKTVQAALLLLVCSAAVTGCSREESRSVPVTAPAPTSETRGSGRDGATLFKQYCSSCHPDGGNVSDPGRTLRGSALKANRITSPEDIVRIMRNPISRMIRFDRSTLSDEDARAIAEYILTTFR